MYACMYVLYCMHTDNDCSNETVGCDVRGSRGSREGSVVGQFQRGGEVHGICWTGTCWCGGGGGVRVVTKMIGACPEQRKEGWGLRWTDWQLTGWDPANEVQTTTAGKVPECMYVAPAAAGQETVRKPGNVYQLFLSFPLLSSFALSLPPPSPSILPSRPARVL